MKFLSLAALVLLANSSEATAQAQSVPAVRAVPAGRTARPATQQPRSEPQEEKVEDFSAKPKGIDPATLVPKLASDSIDTDGLYVQACLESGTVEPLLDALDTLAEDDTQSDTIRRNARWAKALILRREGSFGKAQEMLEEFVAEEDNTAARIQQAELFDAQAKTADALKAYEALLEENLDEVTETHIRLRLALLQMEQDSELKDALAEFAKGEGRENSMRNRAAVVLGLIGRPADAIELFVVDENDPKRFRQEVRVAEWAIRADDAAKAQEFAWRAARSARLKRDRYYGLTILIEAHRLDESLDALIDKIAATEDIGEDFRRVWIELLRERGRYDEAIAMFKDSSTGTFSIEERRQLLEMYREKGDESVMIDVFGELIAEEPTEVEWREGLSRAHLERGDAEPAKALWREFLALEASKLRRLEGAEVMMDLGLDELAIKAAEMCIEEDQDRYAALIFLFGLHKNRGQLEQAEAALARMDEMAAPGAPERFQLADSWEQLGRLDRAVDTLETVRKARGLDASGEDLEMRLAWLYSEIDQEETALDRWREIWVRVKSISRRRYAEDRMMTVASRLGTLADIAIDLEQKLLAGTADERDSGLLVRLYTKVGDPVSASEVIDEFMKRSGGSVVDTLQEKGRVYLACNDYYNYEKIVRQLIEVDPEGEGDYLRQLAMSQLERGKPAEARGVLARLKELEVGTESEEFEAGVLALAGLREEAIRSYRRGLAVNPGRIESYLLMANLMKELGETERAVGMFQYLAETAEKDDLFTIAIDGLLNVEAPAPVMEWARRVTLERLARRHDKMYLYQLLADLAEQVEDREGMLTALEGSLSITGERRPSVLRELMELSKGGGTTFTGRGWEGDDAKHLAYGRRLIGLSEVVPPQVYLDLGEAFLKSSDPLSATKTFRLASDLPDYAVFQRQAAGLFEQAGFREEALDLYKQVLVAQSGDIGLMVKVGELEEQNGRDEVAFGLYREALNILFARQPLSTVKEDKELDQNSFFRYYGSRNIDDFDKYYGRLLKNLLVVVPDAEAAEQVLAVQRKLILEDLDELAAERDGAVSESRTTIDKHPRVRSRANFYRRVAIAYGRPELSDTLDLQLLAALPGDSELLENLCQRRIDWGLYGSARRLLDEAPRDSKEVERLRFLVGKGLEERSARRLPLEQSTNLFLPLLMEGKNADANLLLRRTEFTGVTQQDLGKIEPMFSASIYLDDPSLTLQVAREWINLHIKHDTSSYMVEPVFQKCKVALSEDDYRNLCLTFTEKVVEDPSKAAGFLPMLPTLQKDFEEPLLTEEDVMELLDGYSDGGWGFGLGPVVLLLPEDNRGGAIRTVWGKVKPMMQLLFVMNLLGDVKDDLGPTISEFLVSEFPAALKASDDVYRSSMTYYVQQAVDSGYNRELALDLMEILLDSDPEDWASKSARAQLLLSLERTDEALEAAVDVFKHAYDKGDDDFEVRRAKNELMGRFLPDHLDAFLACLDGIEAERGPSVEGVKARLSLFRQADLDDRDLPTLEKAVEDFPEEVEFLDQLRGLKARDGKRDEALALLKRIVELEPDRKTSLLGYWRGMQNPIKQLEIKEELMAEEEEGDDKAPGGADMFAGLPPGAIMISSGGMIISGGGFESEQAQEDKPTITKVKEAIEAEDWGTARTTFRRLWRVFQKGENSGRSVIYIGGSFGPQMGMVWPADEEEDEDEEEEEPNRGGLDHWVEEVPEPETPRSAYDALAEYEFGVDEMKRLLRSKNARELDSQRDVFKGLLRARILADGEEATFQALTEDVISGRAGKLETTMLLTLLDESPELQNDNTAAVLTDLARSVRPVDIGPLRSLARVQARAGNTTEATRLYKWLATRSQGTTFFFSFDETPTISQYELMKDVKENLEGEDRLAVIEAVIAFSNPGDNSYARENFESLVLKTYMELLEPADAMERSREILENATDFSSGLRRDVARLAAQLYAQNGEIERALECLEHAVCSLDPDIVTNPSRFTWNRPERPGWYSNDDIRKLAPLDGEKFANYGKWLSAQCDALLEWRREERVRVEQTTRGVMILCLRLHQNGKTEKAVEVLTQLAEEVDRNYMLWVIDILRECGENDLANSLERDAFDANTLHLERLHEVVERELEESGPEAALALGGPKTEFVLNERLLDTLVIAAEQLEDESRISEWAGLRDRAAAARKRLEEIAEAEKAEAEGKGGAEEAMRLIR